MFSSKRPGLLAVCAAASFALLFPCIDSLSAAASTGPARVGGFAGVTNEMSTKAPTLLIDSRKAASIMASVRAATAHAKPVRGLPGMLGNGSRINPTMGAAQNLVNLGGPVVQTAQIYNLYVNSTPSTFGFPGSFIADSSINGADQFEHLTDQYVGTNANNRYTYGGYIEPSYNTSNTLHDADIYNIVSNASNYFGTSGYGAIFNVFLPPGVSECSNAAGGCYGTSPFTFCAYHGSFNTWSFNGLFWTLKHLLYTVEPNQEVAGCEAPDGNLTDSSTSTLTHETFETITDPDYGASWLSGGSEIGDLCRYNYGYLHVGSAGTFFNRDFNLQQEWLNNANNGQGACGY